MPDFVPEAADALRARWAAVEGLIFCAEDVARGGRGPDRVLHGFDFADGLRLVCWRERRECGCRRLRAEYLVPGLPSFVRRGCLARTLRELGILSGRAAVALWDLTGRRGPVALAGVDRSRMILAFDAEFRPCFRHRTPGGHP